MGELYVRLRREHARNLAALVRALGAYDAAVTEHVLNLLYQQDVRPDDPKVQAAFEGGGARVRQGYTVYAGQVRLLSEAGQGRPLQ